MKAHATPTPNETLALLEVHPLTAQLRAEKAAEILRQRQEAAATLETLQRQGEESLPRLRGELAAREGELAAHDAAREAIIDKIRAARLAVMQENLRLDRERTAANVILFETADARIDEAITFFRDRRDIFHNKQPLTDTIPGKKNFITETKEVTSLSNAPAIANAVAYCLQAIRELERMKFTPALDGERIENLKKNLPKIDEMTETVSTKRYGTFFALSPGPSRVDRLLAESKRLFGY